MGWYLEMGPLGFRALMNGTNAPRVTGGTFCVVRMEVLVLGFPMEDLHEDLCSDKDGKERSKQGLKASIISR